MCLARHVGQRILNELRRCKRRGRSFAASKHFKQETWLQGSFRGSSGVFLQTLHKCTPSTGAMAASVCIFGKQHAELRFIRGGPTPRTNTSTSVRVKPSLSALPLTSRSAAMIIENTISFAFTIFASPNSVRNQSPTSHLQNHPKRSDQKLQCRRRHKNVLPSRCDAAPRLHSAAPVVVKPVCPQ